VNGEPAPEDFSKREKDGGTAKARVRHGLVDFYVDSVIVRESIGSFSKLKSVQGGERL